LITHIHTFPVAKIEIEQQVFEKKAKRRMASIEDKMHLDREKSRTDAEFCKFFKQVKLIL
jgi:hypothetical protein